MQAFCYDLTVYILPILIIVLKYKRVFVKIITNPVRVYIPSDKLCSVIFRRITWKLKLMKLQTAF